MPGSLITTEDGSFSLTTETGPAVQRRVFVSDKLKTINEALIITGNNPVTVGDDTSDEWKVANASYERHVPELLYKRTWKFATRLQALTRAGDSNLPGYKDAFEKPADCLYLANVWRTDLAPLLYPDGAYLTPAEIRLAPQMEYRIVGDYVHAVAPLGATCKYVPFPVGDQPWSIGFLATLRLLVMADCYRGLNDDMSEADSHEKKAEMALREAASRMGSEEPRRPAFRSTLVERRRLRILGYYP